MSNLFLWFCPLSSTGRMVKPAGLDFWIPLPLEFFDGFSLQSQTEKQPGIPKKALTQVGALT